MAGDAPASAAIRDALRQLDEGLRRAEAGIRQISDAAAIAKEGLALLARARLELAAGHWAEASGLVLQTECLLERVQRSSETLRRWGPIIGVYGVLVLSGLMAFVFRFPYEIGLGPAPTAPGRLVLVGYSVWGGLGGVAAGLFGLYLHASRRDFDRGYVAFYFLKPVLGFALGPLVYLFARAGLMAAQTGAAPIDRHELLYLGAFVVGFGERFSLRLIDRVAAAFFGSTDGRGARLKCHLERRFPMPR